MKIRNKLLISLLPAVLIVAFGMVYISYTSSRKILTSLIEHGIAIPHQELLELIHSFHHVMAIIAVVGAIAITLIVLLISGRISRPLQRLAAAAQRIGEGDISTPAPVFRSADEVGTLSRAFREMQTSLVTTIDALHKEKEMFQVAFTNMTDGLVILNKDGHVLQANRSAHQLLMLPTEAPLMEHLQAHFDGEPSLSSLSFDAREATACTLARRETDILGPLYLECLMTPIHDERGALKEGVMAVRDITSAESEERSKRNFLSLMSHKLFTPLTVLQGTISMFNDGLLGELSDKQQRGTNNMVDQVGKLRGVIEKLINFVMIEESSIDHSKEEIDMNDFLSSLARESEAWFPEKHPSVSVSLDAEASKLNFNAKYLRLIVGQLLDNGLKFNASDPAEVKVACSRDGDHTVITVTDNGIGIPPEFIEKIFAKFYQVEKYFTGNVEGVGLGLTYVRTIAEYFGGDISVASSPGSGSTFTVRLFNRSR